MGRRRRASPSWKPGIGLGVNRATSRESVGLVVKNCTRSGHIAHHDHVTRFHAHFHANLLGSPLRTARRAICPGSVTLNRRPDRSAAHTSPAYPPSYWRTQFLATTPPGRGRRARRAVAVRATGPNRYARARVRDGDRGRARPPGNPPQSIRALFDRFGHLVREMGKFAIVGSDRLPRRLRAVQLPVRAAGHGAADREDSPPWSPRPWRSSATASGPGATATLRPGPRVRALLLLQRGRPGHRGGLPRISHYGSAASGPRCSRPGSPTTSPLPCWHRPRHAVPLLVLPTVRLRRTGNPTRRGSEPRPDHGA